MKLADLIEEISRETGFSHREVRRIARTAPFRYKHYQIPKRSGGKRDIYHPAPALKTVQRALCSLVFVHAPVSPNVLSYRKGVGVKQNAKRHKKSSYFAKLDLVNFFGQIDAEDITRWLRNPEYFSDPLDEDAANFVAHTCCRLERDALAKDRSPLRLTIGAPSSPMISNALPIDLDNNLTELAEGSSCVYTRYADDLTFSSQHPNQVESLVGLARNAIKGSNFNFFINEQKTTFTSRKHRVSITGLIITPQHKLSVGRATKREVRTQVHRFLLGKLNSEESAWLTGMLAYISDAEPEFIERLLSRIDRAQLLEILPPSWHKGLPKD